MKKPKKKFLGYTWVGWLNIIILQWFCIRLAYWYGKEEIKFIFLKRILPLTGWWSNYIKF